MADFHRVIGPERRARLYARCKDLLRAGWQLDRLNEADLERAIAHLRPVSAASPRLQRLPDLFWQGVFAELEAALSEPLAENGYCASW